MVSARKERLLVGVLGLLACLALGTRVHAQRQTLDLTVAPDPRGCVSDAALRARVRHYLSPRARPGQVQIAVEPGEEGARVRVLRDGRDVAERRFDVLPAACNSRLDALALAIALAIEQATNPDALGATETPTAVPTGENGGQPDTATGEQKPTAEPKAETETETEAETKTETKTETETKAETKTEAEPEAKTETEEPPRARSTTSGSGLQLRLFAGGGALIEVAPTLAWDVLAGVDVDLLRFFGLRFAALYGQAGAVTIAGGSAKSQLIGGRALACLQTGAGDFALEGCGGAAGGGVLAKGEEGGAFTSAQDVLLGWLAGSMRAALRYPASSLFSLRLALDGHISIVRPELAARQLVDGVAQDVGAHSPEVVGGAISLELLLALP